MSNSATSGLWSLISYSLSSSMTSLETQHSYESRKSKSPYLHTGGAGFFMRVSPPLFPRPRVCGAFQNSLSHTHGTVTVRQTSPGVCGLGPVHPCLWRERGGVVKILFLAVFEPISATRMSGILSSILVSGKWRTL